MENKRRFGWHGIIALACAGVFVVCAALVGVFVGVNAGHTSKASFQNQVTELFNSDSFSGWRFNENQLFQNVFFRDFTITGTEPFTGNFTGTMSVRCDQTTWVDAPFRLFMSWEEVLVFDYHLLGTGVPVGFSRRWATVLEFNFSNSPTTQNIAFLRLAVHGATSGSIYVTQAGLARWASTRPHPVWGFTLGFFLDGIHIPPPPIGQTITGNTLAWESIPVAASYRVYVNNVLRHTATANPDFYSFDLASLNLPIGTHQVRVVTVDSAGFTRTPWGTLPFAVNGITAMVGGVETQIPVAEGLTLGEADLPIPTPPEDYMFEGWALENETLPLAIEGERSILPLSTKLTADMILVPSFREIRDDEREVVIIGDCENGSNNDNPLGEPDDGNPFPTWAIGLVGGIGGVALIGAAVAVFLMMSKKREQKI